MTLQLVLGVMPTENKLFLVDNPDQGDYASISFTPERDMTVKVTWNITAFNMSTNYLAYVPTTYSGCTPRAGTEPRGANKIAISSGSRAAHLSFQPDIGFFELTRGVPVTFAFDTPVHCSYDYNDYSLIVVEEVDS